MPYTHDPRNSATDRIRLNVGDIWPDLEILGDEDYAYFLEKNHGSERRATLDAARTILFTISRYTRERTGDIEVYGAEWFNNFRKALELVIKNPEMALALAVPYAGGISLSDMRANRLDCDANDVRPIIRLGCGTWETNYKAIGGYYGPKALY